MLRGVLARVGQNYRVLVNVRSTVEFYYRFQLVALHDSRVRALTDLCAQQHVYQYGVDFGLELAVDDDLMGVGAEKERDQLNSHQ